MPHILIPRAHLFGNPSKISAQISPDGRLLAWLAPVDGVLNVWVGPSDASQGARPITNDRKRGIRLYQWTYDGRHLVYLQDEKGNENSCLRRRSADLHDKGPYSIIRGERYDQSGQPDSPRSYPCWH